MKKRMLVPLAAMAALLILWAALRFGVGGKPLTANLPAIAQTGARDVMRVSLAYDAGTRTLRGTQTLTAVNRSGQALGEAVLRLPMNAQDAESTTVSGVTVNGERADFSVDEDDPTTLRVALAWAAGDTAEIAWTLLLRHPKAAGAAVVTLPGLAVWEAGAWRTDPYDSLTEPSYAAAFDYMLEVTCQKDVAAAFGGALTAQSAADGKTVYTAQMCGARDVSLALLDGGRVRQEEADGVLLTALGQTAGEAGALLARAKEALADLAGAGFAYPFPALSVAAGDTGRADGTALSGLIALDAAGDAQTLRRKVTRLAARQIFGVLVESDPWNAPWLSVSLASAAELLAYRQRAGQAAFDARFYGEVDVATRLTRPAGVTVGAGTAFFGSDREMTQVLRDQGAAMLLGLEMAAGEAAFADALALYVEENAGGFAAQAELESALLRATGSDWSGYLADELAW